MIFDHVWRRDWKLRKARRQIDRQYEPILAKARDEKDAAKFGAMLSEYMALRDLVNHPLAALRSDRLVQIARRMDAPVPDYTDERCWRRSDVTAGSLGQSFCD